MNGDVEEAVHITGVYGSRKSSAAQEMADLLEGRNAPYALLDLDFPGWFDTGSGGGPTEHTMVLGNLAAIVGNYLAVGVRFFVLAYAVRDGVEPEDLRAGLPMPLRVIRLTVPFRRLRSGSATTPRPGGRATCARRPPASPPLGPGSKMRRSRGGHHRPRRRGAGIPGFSLTVTSLRRAPPSG